MSNKKIRGSGAPGGNRTHDPRLRKPILYPTELQAHIFGNVKLIKSIKVLKMAGLKLASLAKSIKKNQCYHA